MIDLPRIISILIHWLLWFVTSVTCLTFFIIAHPSKQVNTFFEEFLRILNFLGFTSVKLLFWRVLKLEISEYIVNFRCNPGGFLYINLKNHMHIFLL